MTPEQLREEATAIDRMHGETLTVEWRLRMAERLRAHADALEELARVKKAISESCDEQRGEYFGCRRAERAEAALAECRAKLEVDPRTKYDGIDSRDETIRLLENELEESARLHGMGASREAALQARLAESERKCARLKHHAGGMAYCCEALEMALTKAASIYANRVTLNIDDFLPLTKAYAAYRAEFKEES